MKTSCSLGMLARLVALVMVVASGAAVAESPADSPGWEKAPYLMLDDTLIVEADGARRQINQPSRLPDPIVTSYEDGCFQPYVTVVRDPQSKRFRMWYGIPLTPGNKSFSSLAYIESEDGIHWIRPHRVLDTPPIQFGTSIIDEGLDYPDQSRRYKYAWWRDGGLKVAYSADGISWTYIADKVVLETSHDVTAIDWDPIRGRYMALVSNCPNVAPLKGLRIPYQSVSDDLVHWKKPWEIVRPDPQADIEKGETQFYGMSAAIARGKLLVSFVKVLRDDLNCEPGKTAAELHDDAGRPYAGIGYTVLAWSHDGEHWKRDTEPFLDRNPQSGTWDRAMAWADDQIIIGDYTYIYYGGYRWGHKAARHTERQIGFAQIPRDRYVGYTVDEKTGRLVTRTASLRATGMTINAKVNPIDGELRVRVVDVNGAAYPGFDWDDCTPIKGDRVDHAVGWRGDIGTLKGKPGKFEFRLKNATIYSFDLK